MDFHKKRRSLIFLQTAYADRLYTTIEIANVAETWPCHEEKGKKEKSLHRCSQRSPIFSNEDANIWFEHTAQMQIQAMIKHIYPLIILVICCASAVTPHKKRAEAQDGFPNKSVPLEEVVLPSCGFQDPSREAVLEMQREEQIFEQREKSVSRSSLFFSCFLCIFQPSREGCPERRAFRVSIETYVHNIESTSGDGRLSDEDIKEMINHANLILNSTGFQLDLEQINHRTNNLWYNSFSGSEEEREMMKFLKRGSVDKLNVYVKRPRNSNGEYCGLANLAESAESLGIRDGVTVKAGCVLDRKTVAHEVGHWLNLLHPFTGGCQPPGDLVDDTPYQNGYIGRLAGACPAKSGGFCSDDSNLDNLLDYNPGNCEDLLTPGQIKRMQDAWRRYRSTAL